MPKESVARNNFQTRVVWQLFLATIQNDSPPWEMLCMHAGYIYRRLSSRFVLDSLSFFLHEYHQCHKYWLNRKSVKNTLAPPCLRIVSFLSTDFLSCPLTFIHNGRRQRITYFIFTANWSIACYYLSNGTVFGLIDLLLRTLEWVLHMLLFSKPRQALQHISRCRTTHTQPKKHVDHWMESRKYVLSSDTLFAQFGQVRGGVWSFGGSNPIRLYVMYVYYTNIRYIAYMSRANFVYSANKCFF
jgi:hypothetical protein